MEGTRQENAVRVGQGKVLDVQEDADQLGKSGPY